MSDRSCSMPGCMNILRAKGFCSTHYNQTFLTPAARHKRQPTECVVCAAPLIRLPRGKQRPTCSPQCRTVLQHGQPSDGAGYDRDAATVSRARKSGALLVERVSVSAVFERDNWMCYLCLQPVDRDADCYQLNSATIDHVVPLAQGGSHTMQNCRCACLGCNSVKGEYADKQSMTP